MRLWHKDLISVLPRQQLLGQWRECCLIAKNIAEKGTPNHLLVNKIMDYSPSHFIVYCNFVWKEMQDRGYKCNYSNVAQYLPDIGLQYVSDSNLFKDWHNDRYLMQCFYNLQEKYDCGGINETEYELIRRKVLQIKGLLKND